MTHDLFVFAPAVVALIVMAALLHEYRRPRPRTHVEKRAVALLRSWLTPEQEKQWQARGDFEVIGCDTGRRYRITYRAVMNVHQLDPDGHPVVLRAGRAPCRRRRAARAKDCSGDDGDKGARNREQTDVSYVRARRY
jgi:hypothetical protein